ncbi:MAG: hypothetical protein JWN35_3136 [Frankiales bacterium]|nr:hypothetical protein [Frankiales bacterium]
MFGIVLAVMGTTAFWTANTGAVDSGVQILPGLPKNGKSVQVDQFVGGANAASSTGGTPTLQDGIALARLTVPAAVANKVRISLTWTNPQQVRTLFRSRNVNITVGIYHLVHKGYCRLPYGGQWGRWNGNQASVTQTVYEGSQVVASSDSWRQDYNNVPRYCALMDVGSTGSGSVGGSWEDPGKGALLISNTAPSGYLIPSLAFGPQKACPPATSRSWPSYPATLTAPFIHWGGWDDWAYYLDTLDDSGSPGACIADSMLSSPNLVVTEGATPSATLYLIATVTSSGNRGWSSDDVNPASWMQFYIRAKLMR